MDQNNNLEIYNEYVHEYHHYDLYPSEILILNKFKNDWHRFSILDIGIGTGRTTKIFSALAKNYVGIDYAQNMVQRARKAIPQFDGSSLLHCDARDLSQFYKQPFDYVMFSLNGLDSVGHGDRALILQEIKKVLSPGGHFFFSTHSLRGFKVYRSLPKFDYSKPIHAVYYYLKGLRFNRRLKHIHRSTPIEQIRSRDWAVLITGDHDFKMPIYHVNPEYQLSQLAEIGFDVRSVIDLHGAEVDPRTTDANTLYYLCQLKP